MASPEGASRKRTVVAVAVVIVVIAAGAGWWMFSRPDASAQAKAAENIPASVSAADGSVTLSAAQLRAQGIETATVDIATQGTSAPYRGLEIRVTLVA